MSVLGQPGSAYNDCNWAQSRHGDANKLPLKSLFQNTIRNGFAYIGLSKPRYKRFEGLALDQKLKDADSEPWCGIQIIDLAKGTCAEWFRIDGAVKELFDVAVITGHACPMSIGPSAPEIIKFVTHAA